MTTLSLNADSTTFWPCDLGKVIHLFSESYVLICKMEKTHLINNQIKLHCTKHSPQCPALLKYSVNVEFYVFVNELPGNAVGTPAVANDQPCITEVLASSVCCRGFQGAESSWIFTFPFSLGSVPEVSCGLCSSRQGLGCSGPCPPAAQADQLHGLPRRPPTTPPAQRRGWGCRSSTSKAGCLLFS